MESVVVDDILYSLLASVADACSRIERQAKELKKRGVVKEVGTDIVETGEIDEKTGVHFYYYITKYRFTNAIVSDLKRMMREQTYLQVLLNAVLSALHKRLDPEKFRDGVKSGGEIIKSAMEEWNELNNPVWLPSIVYFYAEQLEFFAWHLRELTLNYASSRRIDPDEHRFVAHVYTAALNMNRLLLNLAHELLRAINETKQPFTSETRVRLNVF